MAISNVLSYFLAYIIPASALLAMSFVVMFRNPKRTEHQLVFIIINLYAIMFLGEFIRHILPVENSAYIHDYITVVAGLLIVMFGFHFFAKVSKMEEIMPKWLYPGLFYVPLLFLVFYMFTMDPSQTIDNYVRQGHWIYGKLDMAYYVAVLSSSLISLPSYFMLRNGIKRVHTKQDIDLLKFLSWTVLTIIVVILVLGLPNYRGALPPYPYLYTGVLLAVLFTYSMLKYNFLSNVNDQYATLFNLNSSAIFIFSEKWIVEQANEAALLRFPGKKKEFFDLFHTNKENDEQLLAIQQQLKQGNSIHSILYHMQSDVVDAYFLLDGKQFIKNQAISYYLICRDVTEEKLADDRVNFLAYHDMLTGVANRASFVQLSEKYIANNPDRTAYFGLLDLDHFKTINDVYGHLIGDEVLIHTASILSELIAGSGHVGRIGGDEFVFAVSKSKRFENVDQLMEQILHAFQEHPFVYRDVLIEIELSVGYSTYPFEGKTYDELYALADQRMYSVKRKRKEQEKKG
ncbi:diguanylate cyclase [Paenisporosarcina sp.]|uniref:GGDEF domain-containing protein n=1 Tax=Paenisporosarcina sp. TaxID=1932001 RepID=UPI003C7200ED